jgi:hypothetical protein
MSANLRVALPRRTVWLIELRSMIKSVSVQVALMLPMMMAPVISAGPAVAGVGIASSVILAVGIGVELGTPTGVFHHVLCRCGRRNRGKDSKRAEDYGLLHLLLLFSS